ncbi:FecR family protein [Siphonobacter sp.]|uniref:FecR family protein n=1 Tax=Siphonobacter sp. TaxID=1869184 RepID=UPI003B3B9983
MNLTEFRTLLRTYLSGQQSPPEERRLDRWYEELGEGLELSEEELTAARKRMKAVIDTRTQEEKRFWLFASTARWVSAAAVLFVLISLGLFWGMDDSVTYTNTSSKPMTVALSEGTTVEVNPGATLVYSQSFPSDRREVSLAGQAFFKVTKDPARPFRVYASGTITEVLGTSFWVRSSEEQLQVEVRTGRVQVSQQTTLQPISVLLTPNQQVVVNLRTKRWVSGLVEQPQSTLPSRFSFSGAPVKAVIDSLEKAYHIPILFAKTPMERCTFSGTLADSTFYGKLELLCKTLQWSYRIEQKTILLEGRPCRTSR